MEELLDAGMTGWVDETMECYPRSYLTRWIADSFVGCMDN